MRGRVAKAVRRATRDALGADPRECRYGYRRGTATRVLYPDSGRAIYRRLKRRTRALLRGEAPR